MFEDRKQMESAIKKILVPVLQEKNFKGIFPHFYRKTGEHIDLITFQFDKWGGGLVVEISYADQKRDNIYIDRSLSPEKLRVSQTNERLRLGSQPKKGKKDCWFRYNKKNFFSRGNIFENTAKEIAPYLEKQAEEWWRSKYVN